MFFNATLEGSDPVGQAAVRAGPAGRSLPHQRPCPDGKAGYPGLWRGWSPAVLPRPRSWAYS